MELIRQTVPCQRAWNSLPNDLNDLIIELCFATWLCRIIYLFCLLNAYTTLRAGDKKSLQ